MRQHTRFVPAIILACVLGLSVSGCTGSPGPSPGSTTAPSGVPSAPGSPSSAAGQGLPAVPGIVKEVEPSVVTIRTAIGLGSGVVYRADGTIVTDAHVVEDQQKQPFQSVQVQFADGSQVAASV
ncbi:MAG: S1C family serine protease, partial [Actinomycetota bacterium]|nr:S1C family serine protease [Actinomycetota bacterium]